MIKLIEKLSDKTTLLLGNYTLLVFLLIQFFIVPFFPVAWHRGIFLILITLIYLNLAVIIKDYRKSVLSYVLLLIIFDFVFTFFGFTILSLILLVLNIVLFIAVVIWFITIIAKSKKVSANIILDSINGYLLLAVLSTMMINLVMSINPEAYAFNNTGVLNAEMSRISEYQYYGLVTLTTLGYGDIVPVTPPARAVSTLIAVSGQLYVAIIVALLVGKFAGQSNK